MANFSVNQVRHLYVAKSVGTADTTTKRMKETTTGAIMVNGDAENIYFEYQGAGGRMRSDLIKIDSITCAKHIKADKQKRALKKVTVTLNQDYMINNGDTKNVISGQDYILRIVIRQFAGMSDEDTYIKYGVVHGVKGMTAETFYTKLKESFEKNFSRELTKLFTFTSSATGVVIEEVEQEWTLGIKSQVPVYFEVIPTTIVCDGDEVTWGTAVTSDSTTKIPNSKKLADLEYFCMGERGDIYRNVGWPNVIPTKYLLDGNDADGYDVLEIHYYFEGDNHSPQKSEKDIVIVGKAAVIGSTDTGLIKALADKGVTVTELK